jgi:tape measure domain-containing protein
VGVNFPVTTTHRTEGTAEAVAAAKRIETATRKAAKAQKDAKDSAKQLGKGQRDAAADAKALVERNRAIVRVMKETGVSASAARQAVAKYGKDTKATGAQVAKLARDLDRAEKELRELTAAQRQGQTAARSFGASLKTLAIQAGGVAAVMIGVRKSLMEIQASIGAATTLEGIERALKVATGSATAGAEALAFVRQESDRLGLSLPAMAKQFSKLSAATASNAALAGETREIFLAVAEASTVLGLSTDDASGALNAFVQIASKGKVQAEELRGQLGERIPGAFSLAAAAIGKTEQELNKMLDAGEVTAEEMLPALAREMRKTFGPGVQDAVQSAAASIARFETAVFEARSQVGSLILREGGLQDLIDIFNELAQMATGTSADLERGGRSVTPFAESIRSLAVALSFAAGQFNTAREGAASLLGLIGKFIPEAALAADKLERWGEAAEEVAEETILTVTAFERFSEAQGEGASFADRMTAALKKEAEAVGSLAAGMEAFAAGGARDQINALRGELDAINREEIAKIDAALAAALDTSELPPIDPESFLLTDDQMAEAEEVYKSSVVEMATLTEEILGGAWDDFGFLAFDIADAIGGKFGDMLAGVVDGVFRLRDAMKQVQSAQGAGGALLGGFGVGQAAGGLVGQLGISTGAGQAGGLLSGGLGAIGTLFGGPIGGAVAGVVGQLIGGLNIFQSGGNDAIQKFRVMGDELASFTKKLEGDLSGPIEQFGASVTAGVNAVLTAFGGTITSLADISIKIREEGDELEFRVGEFNETIASFGTEAEAVSFAIAQILQKSTIEGLSENVASALRESTATSFEQLSQDLNTALVVDQRLMTQGELFLAERTRLLRQEIQATAALGISQQDVIDGRIKEENALNRLAEATALQLAGVDLSVSAGLDQLDAIREQAAQTEALQAAYDAAAVSATENAAAVGGAGAAFENFGEEMERFGLGAGIGREEIERIQREMGGLAGEGASLGEALEIVAGQIEGIDLAKLEQATEAFVKGSIGGFLAQVAQFTGDAELAARAAEFEHQARLLTLRLTFEELKARGLLNEALQESVQATLDAAEAAGPPSTGGGGGTRPRLGGGGRGRSVRDAAESFREAAAIVSAELAGATAAELEWADVRRQTTEDAEKAKIGTAELDAALSDLAALGLRAVTDSANEAARALRDTDVGAAVRDIMARTTRRRRERQRPPSTG